MADDPNTKPAVAGATGGAGATGQTGGTGQTGATGATGKAVTAAEPNPYFPNYPKTKWHSHRGAVTVKDPNEEFQVFKPAHEFHDSPELADMHRDHNDAQLAVGHNEYVKHRAAMDRAAGREPAPQAGEGAIKGPVRNSVAAQERFDHGEAEPL